MVERRVVCQEEKKDREKKVRDAVDSDWLSENTQSRQRDKKGKNRNVEKSLEGKSSHERKGLSKGRKRRESLKSSEGF